jgi:hypothetical protein
MAGTQAADTAGNEWDDFDGDFNAALDAELGGVGVQGDTQRPAGSPDAGNPAGTRTDAAETPARILAADGKHTLPYDALKREREEKAALARRAQELEAELQRLRGAQPEAGAATGQAGGEIPDAELPALSEEELTLLEEDDPLMAKAVREIRATRARVENLERQVEPVVRREQREADTQADQVKLAVDEAIDQTPALRWLKDRDVQGDAEANALWAEAVEIDAVLKQLPKYRNASFAERFAAVVEELEAVHGKFQVPPEYLPAATSTETAREKAARIVEQARSQPGQRPTRLSQLEGGASPETLPTRLGQMSAAEMFALSERMPEEEFDRLGREAMGF